MKGFTSGSNSNNDYVLQNAFGGWFRRSLENYIKQHRERHPEVQYARTLTQARVICFGPKNDRQRRSVRIHREEP